MRAGLARGGAGGQGRVMRIQLFASGAMIVVLGLAGMRLLGKAEAVAFLQGALTLGGGMIICGLFSLKMQWHGIIGAGVLALLGAARGMGNIPDFVKFAAGDHSRGAAPGLELVVTAVCLGLLLRVIRALRQERTRRMLERD
jgi:hypothetical protein